MSRDFDYELRETVHDLADEVRTVNLATAAIRDGRQLVHRRRVVSAAATFAVLAVLVVPFALTRPHAERVLQPGAAPAAPSAVTPSPTTTGPAPQPVPTSSVLEAIPDLPDGMVYASIPRTDGSSLVYNRSTGQYTKLPFSRVTPSPAGSTAAIDDGKRIGLIDLETGVVHWASGPTPSTLTFDWAPDGTQLTYLTRGNKSGTVRVAILTVAKRIATPIGPDLLCVDGCASAWLPKTNTIAVSGMGGKIPIRLIDSTSGAQLKGFERISGVLQNGHGVSDDGALVVTQFGTDAQVTVVSTGETILRLASDAAQTYWSAGHELLVVGPDGVDVYSIDGVNVASYPFPADTLTKPTVLPILMRN